MKLFVEATGKRGSFWFIAGNMIKGHGVEHWLRWLCESTTFSKRLAESNNDFSKMTWHELYPLASIYEKLCKPDLSLSQPVAIFDGHESFRVSGELLQHIDEAFNSIAAGIADRPADPDSPFFDSTMGMLDHAVGHIHATMIDMQYAREYLRWWTACDIAGDFRGDGDRGVVVHLVDQTEQLCYRGSSHKWRYYPWESTIDDRKENMRSCDMCGLTQLASGEPWVRTPI